ncbi:hypothetical protein B1R32_10126 [Abditibacterium utsteinense]|uniref:Uncharacterized protein n=1 Tax=Abditibacterium utsteinense TaxID=1960156 RepID=A0A2S8SWW2_9BACT|nr:hypothetical protein [Abditibacterium utsteinense]PQV65288.1 hypothetical protein B1R32_10126 [Abditibacterium utsteinense]
MIQRLFFVFALCFALSSRAFCAPDAPPSPAPNAEAPRVAFWDPLTGTSDESVELKSEAMTRVAAWMRASGAIVSVLRIDEIGDAQIFSSQKFDLLVTPGEALPTFLQSTAAEFASSGGVLMALGAREAPWSVPLVPDVNGKWRFRPDAKRAAPASLNFGAHFSDFGDAHGTFFHRATPLLEKYLSTKNEANAARNETEENAPSLFEGFLPAPHLEFDKDTEVTPIVRSFGGGKEPMEGAPQIFLARRGNFKALVVLSDVWTSDDAEADAFQGGAALFGALCQIARDFARAHPATAK